MSGHPFPPPPPPPPTPHPHPPPPSCHVPVLCLQVTRGVPGRVKNDHNIGASEVQPQTSRFGGHQTGEHVGVVVEVAHHMRPRGAPGFAVQAPVNEAPAYQVLFQNVQQLVKATIT